MKFLQNLKLVLVIGILETILCLNELAFVINCEMDHVDCMNYWLFPAWVNFPVAFLIFPLEMVAYDNLHLVRSFGMQHAITTFVFIVVGTIWWTFVLTLIKTIWRKWFGRAEK